MFGRRGFGHRSGRRNLPKEKDISMRFVTYLEENGLKKTMKTKQLREIYRNEFSVNYETEGIMFAAVLNCLCFHLNTCQQVLGKVVFGGGEEAALVMFSIDSGDDEEEWQLESLGHSFPCNVCRKPMPTAMALHNHKSSINHRQQLIFREIRQSLERHDLINDKHGIIVTSVPQANDAGVIETILKLGMSKDIVLTVRNTETTSSIHVKDITLLWSTSLFNYRDIREIAFDKNIITPGGQVVFSIGCTQRGEYGYSYVPAVLRFEKNGLEFHILRFLCVRSVSDIFDYLKKTSEYSGPAKHQPVPKDVRTFPGKNLPPLRQNGLRMERMEQYFIQPSVRAQIKGSKNISRALSSKLEQPLTFTNYDEKFSTLIQVEELQMEKDIRNYDMEGVTFTRDPKDAGLLTLVVPGLAENRPSVLRGDRLFAYEQGSRNQRFEGIVHKVEMLDVKLGFDDSMPFIRGKKFDIQFTFNRMSIQMQHRSHERIVRNPGLQSVVFPEFGTICKRGSHGIRFRESSFYDQNLNDEQRQAVENITNGTSRPAPYLIFGPPGTGKTVTFVEAIKQVYHNMPDAVILACAPENSAADLIAERLLPHIDKHKMLRMYAASRGWNFIPEKLKDARVVNFNPLTQEVFYPTMEKMKENYRVIVTTLVTAGRLVSANFGRNYFTHVFIDEAGHAVEPECVIPIADLLNPTTGQLVLAGDPKQLGPVLRSPAAQKYGLGMSLLERLMTTKDVYKRFALSNEYDDRVMTKLVNNYRSHRDIIEVPKKLFYENELNECAGDFRNIMIDWEELPNPAFPIIVHPVFGIDEREAQSPSFFNVSEVETIEKYLKKLLDDNVRSRRMKMIKPEMIGIVTPYKRQVQKIQKMLEKRGYSNNIKVGSVEEFQGQERRIIIISTVRSTKKEYLDMDKEFGLGFLDNPKRFNVAITRAQALLILIGNIEMLATDDNWGSFLQFCEKNGGIAKVPRRDTGTDIASLLQRLRLMHFSEAAEETEISMKELQENPEWIRHE